MSSTGDRIRQLINDNLEVDGQPIDVPDDLNLSLAEAGVPSTDLVAFARLVSREFDVKFSPEDCALNNLQQLVALLDSRVG